MKAAHVNVMFILIKVNMQGFNQYILKINSLADVSKTQTFDIGLL